MYLGMAILYQSPDSLQPSALATHLRHSKPEIHEVIFYPGSKDGNANTEPVSVAMLSGSHISERQAPLSLPTSSGLVTRAISALTGFAGNLLSSTTNIPQSDDRVTNRESYGVARGIEFEGESQSSSTRGYDSIVELSENIAGATSAAGSHQPIPALRRLLASETTPRKSWQPTANAEPASYRAYSVRQRVRVTSSVMVQSSRESRRPRLMSSPNFQLSDLVYTKIIFHALKHPHQTVNGVLLGGHSQSVGRTVDIVDAVPLQHHWTNLSPMMEVGLGMVTNYARTRQLQIVGYYQAPERLDDTTLSPVGERVACKIKESFETPVALVINGSKLDDANGGALVLRFTSLSQSSLHLARRMDLLGKFGDFDDYLEITRSIFNERGCRSCAERAALSVFLRFVIVGSTAGRVNTVDDNDRP
ncbi:hypothetical protein EI94DRAFT_1754520 [Lactarius quietus]|nr:hypothetical protein EI94DRAFT_1754520 [Lactarius quietus]